MRYASVTLLGDDGKVALGGDNKPIERKHAAVFVASEPWSECGASGVGVLKDNQSDVKPVCITSSDREDKAGALAAFKLLCIYINYGAPRKCSLAYISPSVAGREGRRVSELTGVDGAADGRQ